VREYAAKDYSIAVEVLNHVAMTLVDPSFTARSPS